MSTYASAFQTPRPAVALIGAGAMGRALGLRLAESGYPVEAVLSRTRRSAESLAKLLGAPLASDHFSEIPDVPLPGDSAPVTVFRAVPVTHTEAAWVRMKGAAELEKAWAEAGIDVTDPGRSAVNPGLTR